MQGWSSASRWLAVFACVAVSGLGFRAMEASATQAVAIELDVAEPVARATLPCATFGVAAIEGARPVTMPGLSAGLQDCFGIARARVRANVLLPAATRGAR